MAATYQMLINGKLEPGAEGTFSVINPATGQPFAEAPSCSKQQMDQAVDAAAAAFPAWAALPLEKRQAMMVAAASTLQPKCAKIAEVLVAEQGKPMSWAMGEMAECAGVLKHFGTTKLSFEKVLVDNDKERVVQKRVPLGVVGGIAPWNFPPLMAVWKVAEAVVVGNTIVLKPSPYTPLSTLLVAEALANSFPPGVLNMICGGDEVGRWLTEHPKIAKISFTGSTRTGKAIQAAASGTLKRLTLELGGNDAAVVMDDADVGKTAQAIFFSAMGNSGQICTAVKRLYVHESKHDEMVGALTAMAKQMPVGDGMKEGVMMGPINNKMQFERVKELVEDAKKHGAKVHAGGAPMEGGGYFYPPTILTGVAEGTRIVDEEQFGPVLPVMPFKDVNDVIRRVNSTNYGLGGSVWSSSDERAMDVAKHIESGMVWINQHMATSPDVPFGGVKESGVGRQFGDGTLESYTETKVIRLKKSKL